MQDMQGVIPLPEKQQWLHRQCRWYSSYSLINKSLNNESNGCKTYKVIFLFYLMSKYMYIMMIDIFKRTHSLKKKERKKALVWNVYLTQLWSIILLIQEINIFFRSISIIIVCSCKQ